MGFRVARCPVLGGNLTQVTDLEGRPTYVICREFDRPTSTCLAKARTAELAPLSQFLERVAEDALTTRSARCDLL
jgi:hypothetical protein